MKQIKFTSLGLFLWVYIVLICFSCGKNGGTTPPPDPCSGITVSVSGTIANPSTPGTSTGSITVSGTGGSGFTFNINGGAFQSSGTFSGLIAGSYTVIAKNSNGCTGSSVFTLTDPNPCLGITITVSGTVVNPTSPGATNGSITATATGGTGFTFNINGGTFQSSGLFSGLSEGNYTIIAKNGNGCTGSANFTLAVPNPCNGITITVSGTVTNPTSVGASNGSINAVASGSTGFTYSLNSGTFQSSGIFNNLAAGMYTIIAKDGNACTGSANFTLTDPNPCAGVTITVGTSINGNTLCQAPSGMITVTPAGGLSPYTFQLNSGTFQSSNIFNGLSSANYSVTAKDVNGCVGTISNVFVPNLPTGTLFNAVRVLLDNNCVSCHNNTLSEGGMNWTIDCNVVMFKDRIKARAVDANPSSMPPTGLLPASERQKIIDWINAGGKITD